MPFDYRPILTPPQPNPASYIPEDVEAKLGSGVALPRVMTSKSTVRIAKGKEKVEQDILCCLACPVNRRLGQADYGSILPYQLFSRITREDLTEIRSKTRDSITDCVPQITVQQVFASSIKDPETTNNSVLLIVLYTIKGTAALGKIGIISGPDGVKRAPEHFTVEGVPLIQP